MKKKILFLAALAAASTALIGCSSDEALGDQLSDASLATGKGTPMTVVVTEGATTRYGATTTSNLNAFQMFAFNTTTGGLHFFNYTFSKSKDGKFKSDEATWPNSKSNVCNFYALSVNGNSVGDNVTLPNEWLNGSTLKFDYKMPTKDSKESVYLHDDDLASANPVNVDVIDIDNIEDLLVSYNKNVSEQSLINTSQNLSLNFTHALCGVEISARFTSKEWDATASGGQGASFITGVDIGGKFSINYIAIHGLYTKGTYDIAAGTWDTNSETRDIAYYRYAYDADEPLVIEAQAVESGTEKIKRTVLIPDNKLLLIPQTVDTWGPVKNDPQQSIDAGDAIGKAYIEINGSYTGGALDDTDSTDDGVCSYYIPLQFPNGLQPGKKYKVMLNLNHLWYADGESPCFEIAEIGG